MEKDEIIQPNQGKSHIKDDYNKNKLKENKEKNKTTFRS